MISFRFHLVSLVAVFMALGVGVLTGTTVINRGVVARLETQTEGLSEQLEAVRGELDLLRGEAEVWEEAMAPLVAGRLAERQIVLITQVGTSEESLSGVRRALDAARAEIVAELSVGVRVALATEADREALASILGMDATEEPETLTVESARAVAARLAEGPNGTDTLEQLLEQDFLAIQSAGLTGTGLRGLGGPSQVALTVADSPGPSEMEPSSFLVPLVAGLATAGMPVAAAEPAEGADQEPLLVTALRNEAEVSPLIATQDNVDQLPGQIGLVLAIEDLLQGRPGHYGVKDGALSALPEIG